MEFEWDENKRQANIAKHGIDFVEVIPVFSDSHALDDEDTRDFGERRYRTIGMNHKGQILFVVYTWRGDVIRLISARRANRHEQREYRQIH